MDPFEVYLDRCRFHRLVERIHEPPTLQGLTARGLPALKGGTYGTLGYIDDYRCNYAPAMEDIGMAGT